MNRRYPIFTIETECQDCYKCVRECPVKAIRVESGRANVVPELCVACGRCAEVCPAHAKRVRDDLGRAKLLLANGRSDKVVVSLAPSWASEFPGVTLEKMIASLRRLGFDGVGETALGAEAVSRETVGLLRQSPPGRMPGLAISSACPAVCEFVSMVLPWHRDAVMKLLSPLLCHCRMLRSALGENVRIVFFGPCVAKKREADEHPELLDVALTFLDLRRWFDEREIIPEEADPSKEDVPLLGRAKQGALYPIEGGMLRTIDTSAIPGVETLSLTGLRQIEHAIEGLKPDDFERPVFVEALACEGGCVNGPCRAHREKSLLGRLRTLRAAEESPQTDIETLPVPSIVERPLSRTAPARRYSQSQIYEALGWVGKTTPEDELNCGGCGYETCRELAVALLEGKAEPEMCVSFLRRKAQKKANALLRCMTSAAVIVDATMRLIECNQPFAELFGEDTLDAFESLDGLEGASLDRILPFSDLFRYALRTGQDVYRRNLNCHDKLLNVNLFTIEPGQCVGAVIQDVTTVELRREQIAKTAKEVIRKNLVTVQEIACRLGEHMADTEILLNAIAKGFTEPETESEESDDADGRPPAPFQAFCPGGD